MNRTLLRVKHINTTAYGNGDLMYVENPLNVYHLLTRFTNVWSLLLSYCDGNSEVCSKDASFKGGKL